VTLDGTNAKITTTTNLILGCVVVFVYEDAHQAIHLTKMNVNAFAIGSAPLIMSLTAGANANVLRSVLMV